MEITVEFHYPFHWKNGKARVFDSANLLKLLIDAVAEKCGFNDYLVRRGSWMAVDAVDERVDVRLAEVLPTVAINLDS